LSFFLPALPVTLGWILLLDPKYGILNQLIMKLPFVTGRRSTSIRIGASSGCTSPRPAFRSR
jgi:hypothetical protein